MHSDAASQRKGGRRAVARTRVLRSGSTTVFVALLSTFGAALSAAVDGGGDGGTSTCSGVSASYAA